MRLRYLFIFLAIFYCGNFYSQVKNEDDLKKQAEQYFENEDYNLAYKLFAQLVSLYPKDPDYNYKLGVCMLYTEPDKKKPYSYLQVATKNPADAPKDALFYLAKTYHVNYRFDEAIKLYTEYKKIGSAASIKKLQVDREIQACKNGKRLLSNLSDLVVISKKQLNEADYFKGYDVKEIGGKLLVKPDEYKSGYDKKKKDKSVVYLPRSGERLYYSSYGEGGNNGRDIYYVNKLPNGSWSKPTILPPSINTEFDEDYPFLHPNGKTLYFSSKGHNSMGGYDVFKTTYDDATQSWSKPENLEFPINSPDDDILFVTDSLEKMAFFSTGRYSPYGKLDVLKISTERRPMNFAVVRGTVVKEEATQSVKSKITVKNMANGEIVGTYQAQDNGDYSMELPNGGKFIFTVETPGIPTQSDGVQIPVAYTLKPYKQVISYDKKILKIINYFDGNVSDENYSMMIDQIEKKAKLEVNENEPYNNSLIQDGAKNQNAGNNDANNLNSVSTTNPTVNTNETGPKTNTNKNVTNEQLLAIAKTDAKEASDEATKLKQDAQDAFGLATQKTAESAAKQKEADEAIANANTITDIAKKNEELAKANELKEDAKIAAGVANTATNMAKKLEVDANMQQKEADLTNQYITQLETVIKNKNNKEALTKLEQIQKDLDDVSKQKNQSNELFTSLKAESELKQQELANSEKKTNSIVAEINAIKNESQNLEKDLANESDKAIKENISAQIRELNSEIDLKNKELATNNQKIESLKNEVDGVNQELLIAAKILNESTEGIAVKSEANTTTNPTNTTGITNGTNAASNATSSNAIENNTTSTNPPALSFEGISNKYKEQVKPTAIDKTNKEEVVKQNAVLATYNKEVTDLIALDKNELSKTKDAATKQKLNEEIKQLEKQKAENNQLIAANNATIKQLDSNPIAANNTGNKNNTNGTDISNNSTTSNSNSNSTPISNETSNPNSSNTTTISSGGADNNNTASNDVANNVNNTNSNNAGNTIANGNTNATNANNSSAINANENASNTNANNVSSIGAENNATNTNGNTTAITNNTAADNEAIKPINMNSSSDNNAFLNELSNLKNGLNANTNAANEIFGFNNYKEPTSVTLKQAASQKFDAAKQNENNLDALIAKTENTIKNATNGNATTLINEADQLSNKAFELRKESATTKKQPPIKNWKPPSYNKNKTNLLLIIMPKTWQPCKN
ncbi:MAG: PD40 domain-containing protein [Bacteroidetes bacterium]|nr:PD40 domain-containing protein [Bacteroidota bacterium]